MSEVDFIKSFLEKHMSKKIDRIEVKITLENRTIIDQVVDKEIVKETVTSLRLTPE